MKTWAAVAAVLGAVFLGGCMAQENVADEEENAVASGTTGSAPEAIRCRRECRSECNFVRGRGRVCRRVCERVCR